MEEIIINNKEKTIRIGKKGIPHIFTTRDVEESWYSSSNTSGSVFFKNKEGVFQVPFTITNNMFCFDCEMHEN